MADVKEAPAVADEPLRVLGLLTGDIRGTHGDARIKYGQLFDALSEECDLVGVHDVELQGLERYENAMRTMRLPKHRWREASYKNSWAFERRTRRAQELARVYQGRADVILQNGTLFSAALDTCGPPVVVYTDFTYRLTQREDPWRDPFTDPVQRERWNDQETVAAQQARFVLTRSEYTRQSMIVDYGIAPNRVAVVGGGINFVHLPEPVPPPDVPRILFIGKDFERKGGAQLVAAFHQVRDYVPNAELWLVTAETSITGPGIRCFKPTHARSAITRFYHEASVFAMPSRCETWGDVFLEAMAHGLPCIGTTNNAMPEIIQHGETGYVVAQDDISGLAMYLTRLLSDATLRRRMGLQGRERVIRLFTWQQVVRRMLPYLERAKQEAITTPVLCR